MIVSKTPFRCSLLGGASDLACWFENNGGSVLSFTIDKYLYIVLKYMYPLYDDSMRLSYSKIENCSNIDDIQHPVVREVLREYGIPPCVDIHCLNDLPARAGMGSSSVFTVGLINAICTMMHRRVTAYDLACAAIKIERDVLKEAGGLQDQVAAAYGGLNKIVFYPDGGFTVHPLSISHESQARLAHRFMLFYTKKQRSASQTTAQYIDEIPKCPGIADSVKMVDRAVRAIDNNDFDIIGHLLDEAWEIKKSVSPLISSPEIDDAYALAKMSGALGGKVCGSGAGGFLLLYVPEDKRQQVYDAMVDLAFTRDQFVDFQIENKGSQIILS